MSRKRAHEDDDAVAQDSSYKQSKLGSFISVKEWQPKQFVATSSPVTDRGSTFIAFITAATSEREAKQFQRYVRALTTPGTHPTASDHEMLAWRTVALKPGKDGTGGPDDYKVSQGSDDDGEKNGGRTIVKALEDESALDCACVVSRWYGGIMLGPARFKYISDVAKQAIQRWSDEAQTKELVEQLRELDEQILNLSPDEGSVLNANYDKGMTRPKAERIVKARQLRLQALEKQQGRQQTSTPT